MDKSKAEEILLPVPAEETREREERVRSQFWSKFTSFAAQLPFAEDVAAAYYCAMDSATPFQVRGTLLAALAYFIMPMDMVPDIIAFLGFTDDIAVLTLAITTVGNHITAEHREKARETIWQAQNSEET